MLAVIIALDCLLAEFAWLWPEITSAFMSIKLIFISLPSTILTLHFYMCFLVVLLFLLLRHYLPTDLALVVVPCAADVMHPELAQFNLSLTCRTLLSLL
jgi:hypothetical protein